MLGAAIGTVLGTLIGYFKWWERALVGPVNFLLSLPGTGLFPLAMIWFGLTETAIVVVLTYEVALTVTVSAWSSVKAIDMQLIRAGRLFGADGVFMIWRVLIPAALPAIISGYRIAFSRGVAVADHRRNARIGHRGSRLSPVLRARILPIMPVLSSSAPSGS